MDVRKNLTIILALAVLTSPVSAGETLAKLSPGEFDRLAPYAVDGYSFSDRTHTGTPLPDSTLSGKRRLDLPRMEFSDIRITPPRLETPGKFSAPEDRIIVEDTEQVIHYQSWN